MFLTAKQCMQKLFVELIHCRQATKHLMLFPFVYLICAT